MKYCPKCQMIAEPIEAANTCPACGAVLQGLDELSEEDLDRPVVLKWCDTIEEAEVLKAALGGLDVDAFIEDEGLLEAINPYHGRINVGPRVMVRVRDAEVALEFLRSKESGELAITEDDLPAPGAPSGPDDPNASPS